MLHKRSLISKEINDMVVQLLVATAWGITRKKGEDCSWTVPLSHVTFLLSYSDWLRFIFFIDTVVYSGFGFFSKNEMPFCAAGASDANAV